MDPELVTDRFPVTELPQTAAVVTLLPLPVKDPLLFIDMLPTPARAVIADPLAAVTTLPSFVLTLTSSAAVARIPKFPAVVIVPVMPSEPPIRTFAATAEATMPPLSTLGSESPLRRADTVLELILPVPEDTLPVSVIVTFPTAESPKMPGPLLLAVVMEPPAPLMVTPFAPMAETPGPAAWLIWPKFVMVTEPSDDVIETPAAPPNELLTTASTTMVTFELTALEAEYPSVSVPEHDTVHVAAPEPLHAAMACEMLRPDAPVNALTQTAKAAICRSL